MIGHSPSRVINAKKTQVLDNYKPKKTKELSVGNMQAKEKYGHLSDRRVYNLVESV